MPDLALLGVVAAASASLTVGGTRKLLERRRARRELARHPQLGTGTPEGTAVQVTGVVRVRGTTIVAPLTGVECVAARARVAPGIWIFPPVGTRRRSREWFAIVSFLLERDGAPPVIVEGAYARLDLAPARLPRARRGSPELERRQQLMLQLGEKPTSAAGAIFEEVAVTPGMRVSIAGLMMLGDLAVPADELGFRDLPPSTVRLVGSATHPLVIGEADA